MSDTMFVVRFYGNLYRLRRPDGGVLPLSQSGAEYCCERKSDLPALVKMAIRDGVL